MNQPAAASTRSFTADWTAARVRARSTPWARAALAVLSADFSWWRQRLVIPGPDRPSGWTHHYFCGKDGAKLRFDPSLPHRHVCPQCEHVYSGEPWDNAWAMLMHSAAAGQLERASVLVRLADAPLAADARAEFERIVSHYADHYLDYAPHGKNVGQGRVQPQSLDEAIWAISLFRALRWSDPSHLTPALVPRIDALARSVVDFLRPQIGMIHNIHCWIIAAVTECAVWLGDDALLDWCRHHEFGIENQILKGFHAEGLWHEINPHYHYYTVSALLSYREAAGPGSLSLEAIRRLALAINNPPKLAYADGRLPAYADGWACCYLHQFAQLAETARALLPDTPVDLAPYYRHEHAAPLRLRYGNEIPPAASAPLAHRASVAALVFGPDSVVAPGVSPGSPPPDRSFLWPVTGLAVLRNDRVRLALRFNPDGGMHDHRDKLAVDLETSAGWQSLDLGTSGYGSAFTEWMRCPITHNLVVLDGEKQPAIDGRLIEFSDQHVIAAASWAGVRFRRELRLTTTGWTDTFAAGLDAPRRIEWCFHGDGVFAPDNAETTPASLDGADFYRHLKNVRRISPASGILRGTWGSAVSLSLPVPAGFDVYLAEGDGNPNGLPLGFVLLRGRAAVTSFNATFTPSA